MELGTMTIVWGLFSYVCGRLLEAWKDRRYARRITIDMDKARSVWPTNLDIWRETRLMAGTDARVVTQAQLDQARMSRDERAARMMLRGNRDNNWLVSMGTTDSRMVTRGRFPEDMNPAELQDYKRWMKEQWQRDMDPPGEWGGQLRDE
jgi:hypothetical protein